MARVLQLLAIVILVTACVLLAGGRDGKPAAGERGSERPASQSAAALDRAAPAPSRPVIRALSSEEARPAASLAPQRGVRGVIVSPRVVLADGRLGVDPAAWEATVYALVPSRERRVLDRIGILKQNAPGSERGDFEIDLPTGGHLILVQHRVDRPGAPRLLEAWYGYADITESQSSPVDLGRHEFAAGTIEGVLLDETGEPCQAQTVDFSDEVKEPEDPLVRGVHLSAVTSPEGRFAFSVARHDRSEVVARLSASRMGARAERRQVRPGELVELVLRKPAAQAEVVFEVPWSPAMTLWIWSQDHPVAFMREGGRAPAGGIVEESRSLPPGPYVVELLRGTGPGPSEWAREEVVLAAGGPNRIRIDPVFHPARTITGRTGRGATVAWVTRVRDGSTFVRRTASADPEGRFALPGVPTDAQLLQAESGLTPVPPGTEAVLDVGDVTAR